MDNSSFSPKHLTYSINMKSGASATLSGLRSTCLIEVVGTPAMGSADIAIFGMDFEKMKALTTYGSGVNQIEENKIVIKAGSEGQSMSKIYEGTIAFATMDALAMPEVSFKIVCFSGAFQSVMKSEPTSVQGKADAAKIFKQLAQKMKLQFEDGGIKAKINNPYLWGGYRSQVQSLASHTGTQWLIDKGTLAVWPTGQARGSGDNVLFSPQTGLVGYPTFHLAGVIVKALMNPALECGKKFDVKSDFTPANGTWISTKITYDLSEQVPKGPWFMTVWGVKETQQQVPGNQG